MKLKVEGEIICLDLFLYVSIRIETDHTVMNSLKKHFKVTKKKVVVIFTTDGSGITHNLDQSLS